MQVANYAVMSAVRLIMIFFVLLSPQIVHALDAGEELITSLPLKKALDYLRENRPADASRELSSFRGDQTTIAEYYFVSGRLRNAQNRPLEAVEDFSKAYLYAVEGELKAFALVERAETYLRMRYFYEARSAYLVFVKNYPDSGMLGRAYAGLAKSLAETGSLKEALTYYEKSGNAPELLLGKASTLHRLGMIQEADSIYASLLVSHKQLVTSSEEALYYLGENSRMLGRADEAKTYLSLVKSQVYRPKADLGLGRIAVTQGNNEEAKRFFSAAVAAKERDISRQALLGMADMELKAGKSAEAKAHLEEIRIKYPYGNVYEEALLKLARILMLEENYEKAGRFLSELAFASSVREEALDEFEQLLSAAMTKEKDLFVKLWKIAGPLLLDASREKFLLAVAADLYDAGKPYMELMQYLEKYGTASARSKSTAALAEYYVAHGELKKADEYLMKLKGMKGFAEELTRLEARIAILNKDYKTGSEKLLALKKMQPDDIQALGRIVEATREYPRAIARYEKAVKESGGDALSYARLGDIMYWLGRRKDALAYYHLLLGKDPNHDWALYRIGFLSEGTEAEEALRRVSRQDPRLARLAEARLLELNLVKKGVGDF